MGLRWWGSRSNLAEEDNQGKKALVILGLFVLAFLFRQLDVSGTLCDPGSWFQGHAVWHVLCGIGIYTVFRFFHDIRIASNASPGG